MRTPLAILLLAAATASAATRSWTGKGADNKWSTAANWGNNTVPVNGDDVNLTGYFEVVSGQPVYRYASTQNDIANLTLNHLTLTDASLSGLQITVSGTVTVAQGHESGEDVISSPLRLGGSFSSARIFSVAESARFSSILLNGHALDTNLSEACDLTILSITGTEDITFTGTGFEEVVLNNARLSGRTFLKGADMRLETAENANTPEFGGEISIEDTEGGTTSLRAIGGMPLTADSIVRVREGGRLSISGDYPNFRSTLPAVELHDGGTLHCGNDVLLPDGLIVWSGAQAAITGSVSRMAFPAGVPMTLEPGSVTTLESAMEEESGVTGTVRITGGGRLVLAKEEVNHMSRFMDLDGVTLAFTNPRHFTATQITLGPPFYTVRNGGVLEFNSATGGLATITPYLTLDGGTFRTSGKVRAEAGDGVGITLAGGTSRIEAGGDLDLRCRISGPGSVIYDATSAALRDDAVIRHTFSTIAPDHDGLSYTGTTDIRLQNFIYTRSAGGTHPQPGPGALFFGVTGTVLTVDLEEAPFFASRDITVRANTTVLSPTYPLSAQLVRLNTGALISAEVEAARVELADSGLSASAATLAGALTLSEYIHTGRPGNALLHRGPLRGSGTVEKRGGGLLRMAGANAGTFSGTVRFIDGSVDMEKSPGLPALGNATLVIGNNTGTPVIVRCLTAGQLTAAHEVELRTGATLDLSPVVTQRAEVLGSLAGNGGLLHLPALGFICGINGGNTAYAGRITGSGGFTKGGAGFLTLSGNSDYTGATRVSAGTLLVSGALAGSGVEVLDEGTLAGTGQLPAVTIRSGAVLQPGNPGGALRTGNLLMESGSQFASAISGTPAAPVTGSVTVNGTASLSGAVFVLAQSITPQTGTALRFIDNNLADAITGTFAGLAQGAPWSSNALDFTVSYTGGSGNDFALTFTGTNSNPSGQPPAMPNPAAVTVNETTVAQVQFLATDPDPTQTLVYSLVTPAPAGAVLNAQTGLLRFTTYESQGGSTVQVAVRATDNGSPPQSVTATATIHITDVNNQPFLSYYYDDPAKEGVSIVIENQNSHPDGDIPRQTLTYTFNAPVPAGMTINQTNGYITWVPTEAQGGATVPVSVTVTDNGTPPLSHTTSFNLMPAEANEYPERPAVASDHAADEGSLFTLSLATTDADIPAQVLVYSLDNISASNPPMTHAATINSGTGMFRWQTSAADGPGPFYFAARVIDGAGGFVITNFRVFVAKINKPPVITPPGDRTARPGHELSFRIQATDADTPEQTLSYSLITPAPAGLTLNSSTGRLKWTPEDFHAPQIHTLTIRVTDDGTPPAFAETTVRIWVRQSRPQLPGLIIEPRPAAGGIRLRFDLPAGTLYEIQSTQNVSGSWFPRGTFTAPGGEILWIDNPASPPVRRFYRVYAP